MRLSRQAARESGRTGPLLTVDSVSCAYGKHRVLSNVGFALGAGEVVSLIGPNGSGKSTLMRVLMNLLHATHGSIAVDGVRVDGLSTPDLYRLGVAMTFQTPRVFGDLSVIENMMVAKRERRSRPRARREAMELLESLTLAPLAGRAAGELSIGQQKLLDLARTAFNRPRLFLLDEVTAGVHPDLVPVVMDVVAGCVGEDAAALLVTHEMGIARRYCTRLLALHNGQIVADGIPEAVLADERVVEAYIGA